MIISISSAISSYPSHIPQIPSRQSCIYFWILNPGSSPGSSKSTVKWTKFQLSLVHSRLNEPTDPWMEEMTTVWVHRSNKSFMSLQIWFPYISPLLSLTTLTSFLVSMKIAHSHTLSPCPATLRFLHISHCLQMLVLPLATNFKWHHSYFPLFRKKVPILYFWAKFTSHFLFGKFL